MDARVPQEPGRPHASALRDGMGSPVRIPRPPKECSLSDGAKTEHMGLYRTAREDRSGPRRAMRSRSSLIVPMKWGNRPEGPHGGKRGAGKTELQEGKMNGTLCPASVSTKLQRIAELASREPKLALTTLAHYIDIEWMREAYRRTRKDGAVGVGRTIGGGVRGPAR